MTIVDETMGALLVGVIVSAVCCGVSCSQTFYYFTRYRDDPLPLKLYVLLVCIIDSVHQGLISHSIYTYLVSGYGDPVAITLLNESIVVEVLLNATTGLLVQGFFLHRIWRLSGKKYYLIAPVASIFPVLLVLAEFGVSVAYTVQALQLRSTEQLHQIRGLSICMNVFAATADVAIATVLCTVLHTSRTKYPKSSHLINKLIVFSICIGLLTSVCACTSLLTFFAVPKGFTYICFYFLIGRLYCNSLLATLNARKSLAGSSVDDGSVSLHNLQETPATLLDSLEHNGDGIIIRVHTTKELRREFEVDEDPFKCEGPHKYCQGEAV